MNTAQAPHGLKGFDCNTPVSIEAGEALHRLGHRFAVRYVGRETDAPHDISADEIKHIFAAGLGLMIVQHVASESSWMPSASKGVTYGVHAAERCRELEIAPGATVWLDLEGVAIEADDHDVIAYCNNWYDQVEAAGFEPGIYVGWHCGLSASQLYNSLKFERYWAAYNLNRDQEPAIRGVCMKQRERNSDEFTAVPFAIDGNTVTGDKLGDFPTLCVPDEWSAE